MGSIHEILGDREQSEKEKAGFVGAIQGLEKQGFIEVDWSNFEKDKTLRLTLLEDYLKKSVEPNSE